ncbi:hypothetical protein FA13DRAFT_1743187 [Coprinellus micaceus]|uniref:Uncharacterized protein n=1 Tax=Coprinellus micaceus TaxID=71717 RepID=A0A4Y7SER5_COPMI|nr:hypothetical protein FA13DRAFT_1743187 [Coprinellus micaceus]
MTRRRRISRHSSRQPSVGDEGPSINPSGNLLPYICRDLEHMRALPSSFSRFPLHKPKRYLETQELCQSFQLRHLGGGCQEAGRWRRKRPNQEPRTGFPGPSPSPSRWNPRRQTSTKGHRHALDTPNGSSRRFPATNGIIYALASVARHRTIQGMFSQALSVPGVAVSLLGFLLETCFLLSKTIKATSRSDNGALPLPEQGPGATIRTTRR